MYILGIDTSCDETAASVVADGKEILSNIVSSQIDIHSQFGGVFPELASRAHISFIIPVIEEAMREASLKLSSMSAVAVTYTPGLIGSLLIGVSAGKAIAYAMNIPLIHVNHLEAHLYACCLDGQSPKLPGIGVIVSGGETSLIYIKQWGEYELMGRTQDDAAGEAFDKVAKLLQLGYPGGPIIDRLSTEGNPYALKFPMAQIKAGKYHFSFSGLKTAVRNYLKTNDSVNINDIAASFQETVVKTVWTKTIRIARERQVSSIILGGGVVANKRLREKLSQEANVLGIKTYIPPIKLCTDNAAMVAGIAYINYKKKQVAPLSLDPVPKLW